MRKFLIYCLVLVFVFGISSIGIGCKATAAETTAAATIAAETTAATTVAETTAAAETTQSEEQRIAKFKGQHLVVVVTPDGAGTLLKAKTDEFAQKYGVTVDYTELAWGGIYDAKGPEILGTDQKVDVMVILNGWMYEFKDKMTPLNDLTPDLIKNMVPALVKYGTIGKNVYILPYYPAIKVVWYNTDMFKAAGIASPPQTWDDLKSTIKKLNDFNGKYNWLDGWNTTPITATFISFLKSAGVDHWNVENGKLVWHYNDPMAVEVIKFMKSLYDEKLVDPGIIGYTLADASPKFSNQESAMLFAWDNFNAYADPKIKPLLQAFPLPGRKQGQTGTTDGSECIGIPKAAPNPELAAEYLNYILSPDFTKQRTIADGFQPLYPDQYNDPDVKKAFVAADAVNFANNQFSIWIPPIESYNELRSFGADELQAAVLGKENIESALNKIQTKAESMTVIPGAMQ